ncbi:hypothetical protein [Streptomyces sp. NPDC001127]|uniref:hypothetical protein n=1 Tax=Streptomyces sp. NPDC001127 TaxID=3154377 RepID=UPI00331B9E64
MSTIKVEGPFSGSVRIGTGCEESRMHAELADIIYGLLVWAHTAQQSATKRASVDGAGSAA